jgi:hypothetical protein
MKRSQVIMLFAGGTALAGIYAHGENQNCRPDATGNTSSYCSQSSSGHHYYGFGGGTGSSSSSSVARGGFGGMGAAHGGGHS